MGRAPKDLTPSTSPLHYFGAEVRRLRQQRGLSQSEFAQLILQGKDLVRKIEAADRLPSHDFVESCDMALGAAGALLRLWPMLERERLVRLSRDPVRPGRGGFSSDATDRPVLDWLLASEPGTQRMLGSGETADAAKLRQLRHADHLHGAGDTYPQLTDYLGRDLTALSSRAPQLAVGFLELAGYEAVDLGSDGQAQEHYLRALGIATAAGDWLYGGYLIAVSLAHLALHCGDAQHAVRLASAAIRGTEHSATPAVRAAFHAVLARGHARLGNETACTAALRRVEAGLSRSNPADEPEWIRYFGEADLADEMAHCFFDLGHSARAGQEVAAAIELLDPSRVRRLAMDNALYASGLARDGDIDEACTVGCRSIDHAARTTSFRSAHRITLMMAELHPYADLRPVRDLSEYARSALPSIPTIAATGRAR